VSSTFSESRKAGSGCSALESDSEYSDLSEIIPASDVAIGEVRNSELLAVPDLRTPQARWSSFIGEKEASCGPGIEKAARGAEE
jgi:hypothetical protein